MDAHKIVEEDIQTYIRKAMKAGILVNPRISGDFFKKTTIISSKYTRFNDETDYLEQYSHKYENGEYFVALYDGAFFQIHYKFKEKAWSSSKR